MTTLDARYDQAWRMRWLKAAVLRDEGPFVFLFLV